MRTIANIRTIFLLLIVSACSSHRENIMFTTPEGFTNELRKNVWAIEQEYRINKFDQLEIIVVSRSGEALIDNTELKADTQTAGNNSQGRIYRVNTDGHINMPMIGNVAVEGTSISGAESLIAQEFSKKFDQPFVQVRFTNKRAYLLGSPGGKVIPVSEGTTLAEVLASGGGISEGRADNIKLIRASEIIEIDLSDLTDLAMVNTSIQPYDIIYVEPVRRPLPEALRDYSPIFTILTTLVSVTALIITTTR